MGNKSSILARERNAFLPIDYPRDEDAELYATPSLSIQPIFGKHPGSLSPPSVTSSSDSSYGSCVSSTLGQSTDKQWSIRLLQSYQNQTIHTTTEQSFHQRRGSELSETSVFDCVKTPKSAYDSRESSALSLFQSCRRSSGNNEFTDTYDDQSYGRRGSSSYAFNHQSRTSLASNTSCGSKLSQGYTEEELNMLDGDEATYDSDLRRVRDYHVVTTAALPWLTGTAVNPLLRAAYLLKRNQTLLETQAESQCLDEPNVEIDTSLLDQEELPNPEKQNLLSPSASCCSLEYSFFSFPDVNQHGGRSISPLENDSVSLDAPIPIDSALQTSPVHERIRSESKGHVTLVIPWLQDRNDRVTLYGDTPFETSAEQERYIRKWLSDEAGMPVQAKDLKILFYQAKYHAFANSIFALSDICNTIPDENADVCILEEPEHLNWYRSPGSASWTSKFTHVVGIIHTNYKAYVRHHAPAGFLAAPLTAGVNSVVVQANCHRVVKLSGVLQSFVPGREIVENVHGIRDTYLNEGRRVCSSHKPFETRKAYFIGKLIWGKGFNELLELEYKFRQTVGNYFAIDIFGSGNDELEIKRAFEKEKLNDGYFASLSRDSSQKLPVNFMGKADHGTLAGDEYSIFINPSLTEVLCTTTAEAIAMNKFVIIPWHPSNFFFEPFPNCLMYRSRKEFVLMLTHAMSNDPPPLTEELVSMLSWEVATLRCVGAAAVPKRDAARDERIRRWKEEKNTLKKAISGIFQKDD